MRQIKSPAVLQKEIRQLIRKGKTIGFVPTMGALHEGHLSLIRKARRENDIVVLSIFVNPSQFDPKKEDFSAYPRDKKTDILLAKEENVDIIFLPTTDMMYPTPFLTSVEVAELTRNLCGRSRPTHFRGVTTIVVKLINLVLPDIMYLGQKDAQQAFVLKRMVKDLNFATKIKICPTVRAKDGLALSSRNQYLTSDQRRQAPAIYEALKKARQAVKSGVTSSQKIRKLIEQHISQHTDSKIDYIECVETETLNPVKHLKGNILIALAVKFNTARLIDNILVQAK